MNAWFRGSLVLVSSMLASCALESGQEDPTFGEGNQVEQAPAVEPTPAVHEGAGAESKQGVSEASEVLAAADEPQMPSGAFEDIAALCRAQERLVEESLRKVELARREYEAEFSLKPSCAVDGASLKKAKVTLGGPFLDVKAIAANVASGAGTFLVVRTADGWRALPRASAMAWYNDPGCFSIERDAGIAQVSVMGTDDAPALVVVESTDRGHHMEEDLDSETHPMVFWEEIKTLAAACRLGADGVRCDARQVVRVELVPSTHAGGRSTAVHFGTSYRVDEKGTLRTEATYAAE